MHGCNSISSLCVNAEVDSMGGVVDGGDGTGLKTSPRRAAIEKAQAELRQEYDVREERRRELEFLEKGGNPLDFKFGNASSVSVQSTSLTDQHHDLFLNSEAKGSVALTASPHGDSVDSSARPGAASVNEPNTADNLLLFEGENELIEGDKRSLHLNKRKNVTRSEHSSQIDGSHNAKESEDSAIFRPYERRNRSRPNHASRGASWDVKGLTTDKNNQKDQNLPSDSKPKSASINGGMVTEDPKTPLDNDLHRVRAHQTACDNSVPADKLNITFAINSKEDQRTVPSQDDAAQNPVVMDSGEANVVEEREPVASADLEVENETCSGQQNGFGNIKLDSNGLQDQGQSSSATASGMKNFESDSCVQANLDRDVYSDGDMHANTRRVDANGTTMEQTLEFEKKQNITGCEVVKGRNNANNGGIVATVNNELDADHQDHSGGDDVVKSEEDKNTSSTLVRNEVKVSSNTNVVKHNNHTVLVVHLNSDKDNSCGRPRGPIDVSHCELPQAEKASSTSTSGCQSCSSHCLKLSNKAHEDSILEEARIIEAKWKRIAELSIRVLPTQNCRKSHWDFVLEEMAWLANDFAQERIWKIHAAAQLCHRAAFTSRLRLEEQNRNLGIKSLAHTMAKAVMQFWHSVELLLDNADSGINCIDHTVESGKVDTDEACSDKRRNSYMMLNTSKDLERQRPRKSVAPKVQAYALRFLKNNSLRGISSQAGAPMTPDRLSGSSTMDMSWEDRLTEESLFYMVPSNAMEAYRKSVESHFLQCEKTGTSIQGESETFMLDTVTDFGPEEMAYEEDEGETGTYYLPGGYEDIQSSKSLQKKHKHMMKSPIPRSCEVGAEVPYEHYATGTQQSILMGKRPASLNVGPRRKRVRTAPRQRVIIPFTAGAMGAGQAQAKTDASSGDTNSFQDDQSTWHGGSQIQKSVEVDSGGDFEKQLPYDCAETSFKTKKKKKAKNLGSAYGQGWQLDSVVLNEQRDHYLKRLDSHHFESNGSSGLYGQHNAKKLKIMKQPPDNNLDNIAPITGSIPSPAASQMSNMSNQSKFIRIISGRDRGRKAKALKISAGQPGFGSPWSLFEDQALVVLVHDMGPNWELVSDAFNNALQFKCIFRKPKECKERHKILMDKSSGDGADSAEDSGSSQSYPSTLPGIPKGSARQLFQRLQGPMEEDTLKSHFEKIFRIGQKLHYRRSQNENQDLKQIVNVHNSHVIALSQVCPNNLSGDLLMPLDLCDSNSSSDLGYQGSHAAGLASSNQGSVPSLPTSGVNSSLPGSSSMVRGCNLSSTSGSITSVRNSRFGVPRGSTLSVDEQQRMQQYNPMLSGRNLQQSTMPVPGSLSGSDRGVRMLAGGNNMGMMGGMGRSAALSRPGFQGMASSSMLTSGSMHSSSMVGMPSPVNMHSGVGTGPGNSILRPCEAIHMIRPGNPKHQRQMMVPERQMQVTQAKSPGVAAFNGLSSAFCNQTTQPTIQSYTGHAQQPLQMSQQQSHLSNPHSHLQGPNHASSQDQAYAIPWAKGRQLQQQRYLQHQQQQQFAASSVMMPQVQSQSHLPISSALQNSSQVQAQNSSQQASISPVTPSSPLTTMSSHHQQQKHHLPQHGFSRNPGASGLTNQSVKQCQRQPQQPQYQQLSRQHPNPRQNAISQEQPKLLKGIGRGNLVHQNSSVDPSHLNGLSMPPGSQTAEKGDSMMHMMQGQNLYPGSGVNPIQSPKPLASAAHSSSYSQLPQKLHSGLAPASKQQPMISSDSAQAQVLPVTSGHMLSLPQATVPPTVASNHSQMQLQSQPQSKKISQSQSNMQRMVQQNHQMHSESLSRSQPDPAQVDQHTNNVPQISASSAITQGCVDTANVVPAFPTVSPQWKISQPPYDSNVPNPATQVGSLGSASVGNSAGNEPLPAISQGLSSKQISVSLPSHAHNSGAQWPHQPTLPHQQPLSQPILSQQPYQSQEQQQEREQHSPKHGSLQHQPQQQVHHLQPGQGGLFTSLANPNSTAE